MIESLAQRRRREDALGVAVIALTIVAGALTQLPLRTSTLKLKEASDTFLLPPPEQTVVMSLGYRAALADLLWAKVLVEQGLRVGQRRGFASVGDYLDTIIELDPQFREPYLLSDTLLTFQVVEVPISEIYKARRILERGVKERPLDAELWLQLGQYVAFIAAPSNIKDPDEQLRWRQEGARYLARAAELGVSDPNVQWQALGGAGILSKAGERDATIRFLKRILATTEDDELRAKVENQLFALEGEAAREAYTARRKAFLDIARPAYPGQSLGFIFSAGLPTSAACAGGARAADADSPKCAHDWAEWAARTAAP